MEIKKKENARKWRLRASKAVVARRGKRSFEAVVQVGEKEVVFTNRSNFNMFLSIDAMLVAAFAAGQVPK